jgi:hypothetical protein
MDKRTQQQKQQFKQRQRNVNTKQHPQKQRGEFTT